MKKVTITDVARHAGVSIKSVSRVINDEPSVRPALKAKVDQAVAELGYRPNFAARALAAGRSFFLGVLFDNPSASYTLQVINGAYAACRAAGYQLVIENIDAAARDVSAQMEDILHSSRLDGMIVTPPACDSEAVLTALETKGLPYVLLAPGHEEPGASSVASNDAAGVFELVRHLWGLGHRRFGLINGPATHGASHWRREAFLNALAERGADPATVVMADGEFNFSSGIGAGLHILRQTPRPTAIFAQNDDMAAGVFAAAAQLGIKIPDDLSVVGFDDSWIAKSVWPELTTSRQPIWEMTEAAVQLLLNRRKGEKGGNQMFECTLVARGSTAPPRG
ncbi:LacI family DNA-binding transcriptional regulator [Novosphingobium guangzhouense]|uniref:HTH lacI-type domain-containing protein n=1 Tax=Novosphingobium guangzhouense TaxID=1850347 RepID=A0A2K2G6Y5_9SPHN|nr:LacI family DNA-binding transcriptional regulator [Novosphingobium guangzhouense]PNU06801.1 hypothetical protein A8V01_01055 [Novosphingobium guangzhouense]